MHHTISFLGKDIHMKYFRMATKTGWVVISGQWDYGVLKFFSSCLNVFSDQPNKHVTSVIGQKTVSPLKSRYSVGRAGLMTMLIK